MASEWREVAVEDIKAPSENALATGPFGSSISSKYFTDSGVPVIRGSNLSEEVGVRLDDDGLVFLSPEKAQAFRRSMVRDGDLVFTCWGTVNQVGLIDSRARYQRYVISNKQMKLTPDGAKADSLFLYYLFSSPDLQDRIKNESIGSSVPGFNLGQLRAMRIVIPELADQRAIAHILGSLDDKIELNRRIGESVEAMARALFKSWFVDFDPVYAKMEGRDPGLPKAVADLFPDSLVDSELGAIPAGWEIGSFGSITTQRNERVGSRPVVVLSAVASGHLMRSDDHFIKRVYSQDTNKYLVVEQWDFAYNPSRINIGSIGMLKDCILGAVSPVYVVARPKAAYRWFLEFALRRSQTRTWINTLASGSVRQSLSYRDFSSIPAVLPPASLAEEFNMRWSILLKGIHSRATESDTLTALRDALLPKLISGELRVEQPEKFVRRSG